MFFAGVFMQGVGISGPMSFPGVGISGTRSFLGVCPWGWVCPGVGTHPQGGYVWGVSTIGWYASYWNAFLFVSRFDLLTWKVCIMNLYTPTAVLCIVLKSRFTSMSYQLLLATIVCHWGIS